MPDAYAGKLVIPVQELSAGWHSKASGRQCKLRQSIMKHPGAHPGFSMNSCSRVIPVEQALHGMLSRHARFWGDEFVCLHNCRMIAQSRQWCRHQCGCGERSQALGRVWCRAQWPGGGRSSALALALRQRQRWLPPRGRPARRLRLASVLLLRSRSLRRGLQQLEGGPPWIRSTKPSWQRCQSSALCDVYPWSRVAASQALHSSALFAFQQYNAAVQVLLWTTACASAATG